MTVEFEWTPEAKRHETVTDTVGVTQSATYTGTPNLTIEYTVEISTTRRSKWYTDISGTIILSKVDNRYRYTLLFRTEKSKRS